MVFADLDLAKRLERTEGRSCLGFAEVRSHLHPESGAIWMECAGAYAVFDGIDSPVTQSFQHPEANGRNSPSSPISGGFQTGQDIDQ